MLGIPLAMWGGEVITGEWYSAALSSTPTKRSGGFGRFTEPEGFGVDSGPRNHREPWFFRTQQFLDTFCSQM
jgi:hypothetical protein